MRALITRPGSSRTLGAMALMVAAMASFSVLNVAVRILADDGMHSTQTVLWRNVFSMLLVAPLVLRFGLKGLRTHRLRDHFWRATIGVIGMQSWFYAVTIMPLNSATALSLTSPIITAVLAILLLGERAGWHRWGAIIAGFIGTLIILRPGTEMFAAESLIVLFAASMWALAGLLVKTLTRTERPTLIVYYMGLFMTAWSLPAALPLWQWPHGEAWGWLALAGIAATGAQLGLAHAFARADMVVLMPFDFSRLVFTGILAYLCFDEVADTMTWLGAAIIVASAVYITHREALHKKRQARETVA